MIDAKQLAAEVRARDGIRIEPGDPAFALVTMNRLVLEEVAEQIAQYIRKGTGEFAEAVHKAEARAGKTLAEQVKDTAAEIRGELERDIEKARLDAGEIVYAVHRAHTRAALIRWGALGVIAAAVLFGAGLWIGAYFVR